MLNITHKLKFNDVSLELNSYMLQTLRLRPHKRRRNVSCQHIKKPNLRTRNKNNFAKLAVLFKDHINHWSHKK